MIPIETVQLQQAIVHRIGNPTKGQALHLSETPLTLNDEAVRQLLCRYFLQPVNPQEQYQFTHASSLELNELFTYARQLFDQPQQFTALSHQIARYLYQCSTHARVKEGELYVALLSQVPFEDGFAQAIGLFKSETKETYLRVLEHGANLEVVTEDGINLQKLDKGCLIFNTQEANGYRLCVVDATNKQQDAQYWVQQFLQVTPVANAYRHTNDYLGLCRQFATQNLPQHFEVTKGQQIDLMQRSLEYFQQNDQFDLQEFTTEVIHYPEMVDQFMEFKNQYAQAHQASFTDAFDINADAVKRQQRSYKSVLKLDKNFHIYIHGRRDLIERGFDETTGKHYYKVYFDEES